jgi:predicted outer membrane lipoprotein
MDWTENSRKDYYALIGLLILLGLLIASAFGVIYASFFYTWLLWILLFLIPIIVLLGSCIFQASTIRFFYRKGHSRFNPKLLI